MRSEVSEKLMDLAEVAEILNISVQTLRRWIRRGKLPAVKLAYNVFRIEAEEVDKFIERSRVAPIR